jgi:hypothetical protein
VRRILNEVGFEAVSITRKEKSEEIIKNWNFKEGTERVVFSAYITARKPKKSVDDENDTEK